MTAEWMLPAIGLLLVTHLAVLAYILKRDSGPPVANDSGARSLSGEGVDCPHCGERNEPEYRFCRQCVAELPTGRGVFQSGTDPRSRRTL